jgi:hypothetical protein
MAVELQTPAPRRKRGDQPPKSSPQRRRDRDFSSFDRSFYMYVKISSGLTIWNRARSMLHNGHRPSAVALNLFQNYGVQIDSPSVLGDASRDDDVLQYFSRLVVPDDAITVPSIFETWGRA